MRKRLADPSLFSTTMVWARTFAEHECLNRDHRGRRIIADAEGSGLLSFTGSSLCVETEAVVTSYSKSALIEFHEGVTAWVEGEDPVKVQIRRSAIPFDAELNWESVNKAVGCGWCSAIGTVTIDGEHRHLEPGVITPYFQKLLGRADVFQLENLEFRTVDKFDVTDESERKVRNWSVRNVSDVFTLESFFPDGTRFSSQHLSHLNTAAWQVDLPVSNLGIRIKKLHDRFHGRQRARVFIDRSFAGWWYEPEEDRQHRWSWVSFGVPAELTSGKKRVEISIDPPPASPLWDVAVYEIEAVLSR